MASNNGSALGAIQIVHSVEQDDGGEKVHVIQVKEKHGNGPRLRDVLCLENKDLPIQVISICGRTRTGKSFLLNLMIKYLETEGADNWREGSLPSVFEWKTGTESITKGLWICPRVFKRRNKNGQEVGILLLDNQGLFDGEQSDGVSIAISGISTTLSCYQIFNLKDSISDNELESIWRHLISDESNLSDMSGTKLVFCVRDFLDEEKGCGLEHGKAYMEAEQKRGSEAHKAMWDGLLKTFPEIICLLLPFPGVKVKKGKVTDMKDIDATFLDEVEKFFTEIFNGSCNNSTKLSTGSMIYQTIQGFHGKEADESLSFANVFTEQGNEKKLYSQMWNFHMRIESYSFQQNPSIGPSLIEEFCADAKKKFKGKSADEYLSKLKVHMIQKINETIEILILKKYKTAIEKSSSTPYTHSLEWDIVRKRLSYLVGSDVEKNEVKGRVIQNCAKLYYEALGKELVSKFESYCKNKTLDSLRGYDEAFVSDEFRINHDFETIQISTLHACKAIWLKEKETLRLRVQCMLITFVSLITEVDKEWLEKAAKTQFKFYEIFTWNNTHWIEIRKDDASLLELVGYTMYKSAQKFSDYSEKERKIIHKIAEQIKYKSPSDSITLTCIFLLYEHDGKDSCEPLFKVKEESGCSFIDIKGRTYQDWEAFENGNKLPNCLYCYPCGGEYNRKQGFRVGYAWSPASSFGSKVVSVLDVAGKVVALGSAAALGAAVAFPALTVVSIGGAIAAASAGGYGIVRGAGKILDKVNHEEVVEATDVIEVVANGLSVATAGLAAGAVLMTSIGKELACAPAIIQSISSLTGLIFQLDSESISYLSLANEISLLLLFNSKSIEGAMGNIRKSYNLPRGTSSLDTLKAFISKNSLTFPKMDGERLTTEQYFSDGWKSLLLTAIMNKPEHRPIQFLRETVDSYEDLRPLQNWFDGNSHIEEQIDFFKELITSIGQIVQFRRNNNCERVKFHGIEYVPSSEVEREVALAGVCTGLTHLSECSHDEYIQQVCSVAREVLKLAYRNAETADIQGLTAYLKNNSDVVIKTIGDKF